MRYIWVLWAGIAVVGAGSLAIRRAPAEERKAPPDAAAELSQAPRVRPAAEAGVGRLIPDLRARDLDGRERSVARLLGQGGLVLAVVSSSCPVGRKLAPALGRLESDFAAQGIPFAFVAPMATDTRDALRGLARDGGWKGPVLVDGERRLVGALAAESTTEVFVLDARRTLVYRGAVSDQYGPTWSRETPRSEPLRAALRALAAGEAPEPAATTAPGCALDLPRPAGPATAVTYHARVSRIVQTHCGECHRDGGVAPFALATPQDLIAHSAMIRRVVEAGRMPPWFAAAPAPGEPSKWANDRTMPAADRADLLGWLAGSRPLGDPADAPLPRKFAAGWLLGKPDAVFELPAPVSVKAEGTMPYVTRDVPTNFTEEKWVQSIEVAPTDRSVVHHVLVFVRAPGAGGNALVEELTGFFGIYVPGNSTLSYPEGFAKRIPAGATLRFQLHYTPNGRATTDQTRVGFRFAPRPPEHEVRVAGIANIFLGIPPGAADHAETARLPVPVEAKILAFLPHMHLRGKAARFDLIGRDGRRETLLDVPRYDFNWQLYYRLAQPVTAPAGSRLEFTGRFDNSAANPANPDPTKRVRWGAQTYDEMLLGYVEYYLEGPGPARAAPASAVGGLFNRVDRDGDGRLTPAELSRRGLFRRLDRNGDGVVTPDEARPGGT
jgi:mono/diheme cytochrome c family protein